MSVTPSGWWFSTAGPRHKPDAYHCLGGARLKCVRLASVEYSNTVRDDSVTTKFEVRDVCVPLPESQETPTALCVDVVFVEFATPAACANQATGVTVYRRKAFSTITAQAGTYPLVATYDVPLILRPKTLRPVGAQAWKWEYNAATQYNPRGDEVVWSENFTLARGEVRFSGFPCSAVQRWREPITQEYVTKVYDAYCAHRLALVEWASRADWSRVGEECSKARPRLPGMMRDVPVWFPSRIVPHVPGVMAVDESVSSFEADAAWWHMQVSSVLRRSRVAERAFEEEWRAEEQRTACVAMRAAMLWASSRMYATDWITVPHTPRNPNKEFIENDAYYDLRVQGGGDCDDYALCVYRAFRALAALHGVANVSACVRKAASAAAQYVPFLCSGLYHDTSFATVPACEETNARKPVHPHAFVVAFPESWCVSWFEAGAFPPEHQPLIGDGTCWPDPCMDGGARCECEGFVHETSGVPHLRAALVCALSGAAVRNNACDATDAFSVPFTESFGGTMRAQRGRFQMHDCVVSLLSSVPSERWPDKVPKGTLVFQFRERANESVAGGQLRTVVGSPGSLVLRGGPPIPPKDLALFRDVLSLERPAPVMRSSRKKRDAMRAAAAEFGAAIGMRRSEPGTHTFALLVGTEHVLARYPEVRVGDKQTYTKVVRVVKDALDQARIQVVEVCCDTGTEFWVGLRSRDDASSSSSSCSSSSSSREGKGEE